MLADKTVGRGARSQCCSRLLLRYRCCPRLFQILLVSCFVLLMFHVVVLDFLMVLVLLLLIFRSSVQLNVALEFRSKTIEKPLKAKG